jgi:hypothetical protein
MRNTTDQATAELPTLEGYQYKRNDRDNQSKRAAALGYMGPKERARCEICSHFKKHVAPPNYDREFPRCTLGNFQVMRGGLCSMFKERS